MDTTALTVVAVLFALLLRWLMKTPPSNAPPEVKTGIPFFGAAMEFGKNPYEFMRAARAKHGDVFRMNLVHAMTTVVAGEAATKAYHQASDKGILSVEEGVGDFLVPMTGFNAYKSDINITGAFSALRQVLAPRMIDVFSKVFQRRAVIVLEELVSDKVDLKVVAQNVIGYCICDGFFGSEFYERHGKEYMDLIQELEENGSRPEAALFPKIPSPAIRKCKSIHGRIKGMFRPYLSDWLERNSAGKTPEKDCFAFAYLDLVVNGKDKEQSHLLESHFFVIMISITLAAVNNSVANWYWVVAELLANPDEMDRVVKEQEHLSKNHVDDKGHVKVAELAKDPDAILLDWAVKETLRIHTPSTPQRKAVQDFQVGGYTVPKGEYVILQSINTHRDPSVFDDPMSFVLDRWAGMDERSLEFKYKPWGHGRHKCLGMHFAAVNLKICWSTLLRNYDIKPVGKTSGEARPCAVLPETDWSRVFGTATPMDPLWVSLKPTPVRRCPSNQ